MNSQPEILTSLNPNDTQALFDLLTPFTHLDSRESFEANLRQIVTSPSSAMLVVRGEDGQIVGCGIGNLVYKAGRIEARLDEIVVSDSMQGKGLGKAVSQAVINWAKNAGASMVELTSRPSREGANHLYQKLGFKLRETNVYTLKF